MDGDGGAGLRVEVRDGWTWIVGASSSLGCLVGGTAAEALERAGPRGWVACGPMFDREGPRFALRDTVTDTANASREPSKGLTACVGERGVVGVQLGAPLTSLCRVAVQGYPTLAYRGRVSAVADSEPGRRVALAVLGAAELALVGGYGTVAQLGRELVARRARAGLYLDGGRAAHLRSRAEVVWEHTDAERPASWVFLR